MRVGLRELRVERVRIDVDAVAIFLASELHHERHDVDAERLCVRWGDVGCAVGDEMDHITRGRAHMDSAPGPRRAIRTQCPGAHYEGMRPEPPHPPTWPRHRGTPWPAQAASDARSGLIR